MRCSLGSSGKRRSFCSSSYRISSSCSRCSDSRRGGRTSNFSLADCSDDDPLRRYETIKCSIISNSHGDRSISARLESMKTSLDGIKA